MNHDNEVNSPPVDSANVARFLRHALALGLIKVFQTTPEVQYVADQAKWDAAGGPDGVAALIVQRVAEEEGQA